MLKFEDNVFIFIEYVSTFTITVGITEVMLEFAK